MARLTDKDRELILADYHTGEYSQRELSKRHSVSVGTISKITKEETVQNEHIMNAQVTVLRAKSELPNEQMNAIMNAAQDKERRERLVYGNAELMASKIPDVVKSFIVEKKDEETGEVTKEFLMGTQDLKQLAEANDKLAITLNVAERHAPKQVTAIQVNNEEKEVRSGVGELYKAINE